MRVTRGGFTLVEILVGMTLFSVVIVGLAGLQTVQSVQGRRVAVRLLARSVLTTRTEGWQATAFTSLPTSGTTGSCMLDTISARGTLRFFRCDTVSVVSTTQRQVSVNVLAPVNQRAGAVTSIPSDSNAVALNFVRLNARLVRVQAGGVSF